ncbi:MAG: helix-turn-helix domain-containing protein [Chloroflexi bacterium]|nr:helix-turn-helix domain-containing protein [Chloroflexota bacterium]
MITKKQAKACLMHLNGDKNVQEIAKALEVSTNTIVNWRARADYQLFYQKLMTEYLASRMGKEMYPSEDEYVNAALQDAVAGCFCKGQLFLYSDYCVVAWHYDWQTIAGYAPAHAIKDSVLSQAGVWEIISGHNSYTFVKLTVPKEVRAELHKWVDGMVYDSPEPPVKWEGKF